MAQIIDEILHQGDNDEFIYINKSYISLGPSDAYMRR